MKTDTILNDFSQKKGVVNKHIPNLKNNNKNNEFFSGVKQKSRGYDPRVVYTRCNLKV